jgi:hypothetical protein
MTEQLAFTLAAPSLAPSTTLVALPQWLQSWPLFVLTVLAPTLLVGGGFSVLLYTATIRQVLLLAKSQE